MPVLLTIRISLAVPPGARGDEEPAGPLVLDAFYFSEYSSPAVLAVGQQLSVDWRVEGGGWTSADLSLSWTGDDTAYFSDPGQGWFAANLAVTTDTPGTYQVFAEADFRRCHHTGLVCTNTAEAHFVRATNDYTYVAVTNVTSGTNLVAVGDPALTLTAQMTPVAAGQFVYWEIIQGSGELSTNQGLTVSFKPPMNGGMVCVIRATCGSSSATATVYVCAVTALAANRTLVAVGDTVRVNATHEPCTYPAPTWGWQFGCTRLASDATTLTLRVDQPGACMVYHEVGTSEASWALTGVGVKEIQYAVGTGPGPRGLISWRRAAPTRGWPWAPRSGCGPSRTRKTWSSPPAGRSGAARPAPWGRRPRSPFQRPPRMRAISSRSLPCAAPPAALWRRWCIGWTASSWPPITSPSGATAPLSRSPP